MGLTEHGGKAIVTGLASLVTGMASTVVEPDLAKECLVYAGIAGGASTSIGALYLLATGNLYEKSKSSNSKKEYNQTPSTTRSQENNNPQPKKSGFRIL